MRDGRGGGGVVSYREGRTVIQLVMYNTRDCGARRIACNNRLSLGPRVFVFFFFILTTHEAY